MMNNKNENNEYNFNNEALHFESNPYVFETDPVKKAPVTKKHIGAKCNNVVHVAVFGDVATQVFG